MSEKIHQTKTWAKFIPISIKYLMKNGERGIRIHGFSAKGLFFRMCLHNCFRMG